MASVDKMAQANADSEMEEGEIVDDLDDLSDISSEEEFLLRQRLEVLEDYNNALGRTKKKRSSGIKPMRDLLGDLSEISAAEIEETKTNGYQAVRASKTIKQYSKPKRRKEAVHKHTEAAYVKRKKDHKRKSNYSKKKLRIKVVSETSDESEDEYKNKRRKLADAVIGHRGKTDTSTLSARLKKMLYKPEDLPKEADVLDMYCNNNNKKSCIKLQLAGPSLDSIDEVDCGETNKITSNKAAKQEPTWCGEIELLTSDDDYVKVISNDSEHHVDNNIDDTKPFVPETEIHKAERDSDEDLAQLRQQVLSTKTLKAKPQEPEIKVASEDEDSDTAELRLICLKSTLLKRAIEMKQKQKLQKRLSMSAQEDDILNSDILFPSKNDSGNNTDIESMDMDMGSDVDDKMKDAKDESRVKKTEADSRLNDNNHSSAITSASKEEELEEDEDLLRAKLLTSLSKNLPNLVSPELLNTIDEMKTNKPNAKEAATSVKKPEEKRFIIKLGESDSEGEHEATKNLTKMHMKLAEQNDFQQQLDLFLKSTRMQVENTKLPDVVQKKNTPKKPEKYVAKTVKHLPKSEQIEYKNLVRRMAELEKMKQLRQASINSVTQPLKETLKPINAVGTNLEEKITISRKRIADESAKMLKLKDEATKLSQKYKIVANELHNISTAITLNKKQQRAVQTCLAKIRQQHQTLIKSSSTSLHSKVNGNFTNKVTSTINSQKENTPKDEYKNVLSQKTVKISVVNDLNKNANNNTNHRLSIEVNVANNTKVVKMPTPEKEKRKVEFTENSKSENMDMSENINPLCIESCDPNAHVEICGRNKEEIIKRNDNQSYTADDYKSPLDAFGETSWKSDPNAILCPFEVGGQCKDSHCKYLHTQISKQ